MKKKIIPVALSLSMIFILLISCASGDKEYTECQERCEYNRRYCIENCGAYNRAGFSFDIKDSGGAKPYSCQEKCNSTGDNCKAGCQTEN